MGSDDVKMLEMCVSGIMEQSRYKKFMVEVLADQVQAKQLQEIIKKCLDLTDDWNQDLKCPEPSSALKPSMLLKDSRSSSPEGSMNTVIQNNEESNFRYSMDGSNFAVPEFMRNDLESIRQDKTTEMMKFFNENSSSRLGKIRNSIYFIISRGVKFGLDTNYLISECNLIPKLISDMSIHNSNDFIFENLLLVISSLNHEKVQAHAIVDLIGNNFEVILDQIFNTEEEQKKNHLLKVVTTLILEASEHLACNTLLFKKIFTIAKDHRSDNLMVENILWLATSLCEQSAVNRNFGLIISAMMDCQIIMILWKCLSSKQERIIL